MSQPSSVPLLDITRSLPPLEAGLGEAFWRVIKSGHYILGPEVEALEKELAPYCQSKHAIGTSSGTDALLLALMALDIGDGDEVICPTYTFFATAGAIWRSGARPVFVDCCPGCYNALPSAIAAKITAKTRAIMPVHLFGQSSEMQPVLALAQQHKIAVIEDAAQALGAEYQGKRLGSLGTIGCFSFFPSKNLGAFGDAGLCTTQDDAVAAKLRLMRVHGGKPKYYHSMIGGNFRIDALQAALLRVRLAHLESYTAQRQRNAAIYTQLFKASGQATTQPCVCRAGASHAAGDAALSLPTASQSRHIYNQYIVRVHNGRRDQVRQALSDRKIGHEIYYPVPMHMQPCFASLGHKAGDFPHAEAAAHDTLALPIFPELRADEIEAVAQTVLAACQ